MPIEIKSQKTDEKSKAHRQTTQSFLSKEISFVKGFSDKRKGMFYGELSILFSSGVDIERALVIIAEQLKRAKEKQIVEQLRDALIAGKSLSAAMEERGDFSPYEFYSLRIGEETGNLRKVLEQLAQFYKRKVKQRRQVVNALTYPLLVVITSLLAVGFMMNFVVPMFSEVFNRFNGELPALTQKIINLSEAFQENFLIILLLITAMIGTGYWLRKNEHVRKYSALLLLKMPVVGNLTKKIYSARFSHSMALLVSAHVPMLRAIELIEKMIVFHPYQVAMRQVREGILKGEFLFQSLEQFSVFDKRLTALVKVAEEVNKLDTVFDELSEQYNDELEHQIAQFGSLLEPVLIVFVGLLVGVILIAMYLPMFQISSSIGG